VVQLSWSHKSSAGTHVGDGWRWFFSSLKPHALCIPKWRKCWFVAGEPSGLKCIRSCLYVKRNVRLWHYTRWQT
jgi:hypothetical protein